MNEAAVGTGGAERLTPFLRRNPAFLTVLTMLIFLPGLITYFGPTLLPELSDLQWMGIGWGVAIILVFIGDENFVPGKANLSTGFRRPGTTSHRLVTNPLFIVGLILLMLGPPPIAYFGPVAFLNSPDWTWLLLGWIVAAAAAFTMYLVMRRAEAASS